MKINYDYLWLERQAWIQRFQARETPWIDAALWCLLGGILTACLMAAVPDYQGAEDFTDEGVGCIDDCLEPAEPTPLEP